MQKYMPKLSYGGVVRQVRTATLFRSCVHLASATPFLIVVGAYIFVDTNEVIQKKIGVCNLT